MKDTQSKSGLVNSIIILFFCIIPALLIWYFLGADFNSNSKSSILSMWSLCLVAIGFVLFNLILGILLLKFKIVEITIFNFLIPVSIILMIIMLSFPIPTWGRALLVVFSVILITFPINMATNRYLENMDNK